MSDQSPVYGIVQLDVTDMERFFGEYAANMQPINQAHGVEVLVGAPEVETLEGEYDWNLTVVLKVPSAAAARAWYADPAYQPLKAKRRELTNAGTSSMILAPAVQPPAG